MNQPIIEYCETLQPSMKQFKNFRQFVQKLDKTHKNKFGLVKIKPPKQWISRGKNYEQKLKNLVINSPIEQNIFGKAGIYECLHIPKKSINFDEYKMKSMELDKITKNKQTQQVEKMFWKNIAFSPPLYGADLMGSLMDESSEEWNLNNLQSVLKSAMSIKVKGINTPYCYVGSWKALFCWHTEDLDLSGINFLHEGKPKFWYCINHLDKQILEKQASKLLPQHYNSCKQFLRHKMTLINPYYLKKKYPELKICKVQQKKGQIILIFGGSYHCGFNFGFNIAQAVNYGTLDWLRQMPLAKPCKCIKSSVRASQQEVYKLLSKDQSICNTKQFKKFQQYIFNKVEEEESDDYLQEAKKGVKSEFSRKIRKNKKPPKKVMFNNEEYQIQNWAQCQKCGIWRTIPQYLPQKYHFFCIQVKKVCHKKDKIIRDVFTISKKIKID